MAEPSLRSDLRDEAQPVDDAGLAKIQTDSRTQPPAARERQPRRGSEGGTPAGSTTLVRMVCSHSSIVTQPRFPCFAAPLC